MLLAVVYFDGTRPGCGAPLLEHWLTCYESSGNTIRPCLVTDRDTNVPEFWRYAVVRLDDAEPPIGDHPLHKCGWMKAQAFDVLGRCVVIDSDAFVVGPVDHLREVDAEIALAPDPAKRTYADWPELGEELNSGVMVFNSPGIAPRFRELYLERQQYLGIPFYDELLFTAICRERGTLLDVTDNWSHWYGDPHEDVRIVHFHGDGKSKIEAYMTARRRRAEGRVVRRGATIGIRYRGSLSDGTVLEETKPGRAVEIVVGGGRMAEVIEEGLLGAGPGERRRIDVPAARAFGERREEFVTTVDRSVLPSHVDVAVGKRIAIPRLGEEPLQATITAVDDDSVTIDANHVLAGRDIAYDVEVVDVR